MELRLDTAGAIPPPPALHDQGIPWHFGDPLREQRYLIEQPDAIVDVSNRGVVTVSGADRLTWLNDLTTQLLLDVAPGDSRLALILDPHGRVEHELHLVDDGATTWLVTQPGRAEPLARYLESMKFMRQVEVADRSADLAVVWEPVQGPDATHPTWLVPPEFAARGYAGREVVLPVDEARQRLADSGHRAGSWALEALRVAALMPRLGCDTDDKTIPNEVGWLGSGVHLAKGCYRGQETVAKVHNLGRPPRRLALLHIDGSADEHASHCDRIMLDGREVGWVGTGAVHFELGPIATAMLKRNVPQDAVLTVRIGEVEIAAREA